MDDLNAIATVRLDQHARVVSARVKEGCGTIVEMPLTWRERFKALWSGRVEIGVFVRRKPQEP